MTEKKIVLTYEGLKRHEEELEHFKIVRRKDVAEKIKEARGQGDLSENAEYDSAKEEQAEIEARIVVLEKMLRNVEVIDQSELEDSDTIMVGCKVTLLDKEFDEEIIYTLVGSAEADPVNGKISNESPLGSSILNHIVGDEITVNAPEGKLFYKVLAIN
jgi:transcription elongation factor GreA